MALMNKFKAVFKKSLKKVFAAAMVLNDMKARKKSLIITNTAVRRSSVLEGRLKVPAPRLPR